MITCIDAFKNLNIEYRQGQLAISPCCVTKTMPATTIDFVNNQYLNQIRTAWTQGQFPVACTNCKQSESQDIVSRRQGSNQWYQHNQLDNVNVELVRLDYWTGDLCNLACAICGPRNSSAWKQELNLPAELKSVVVNQFWRDIDLTNLQFVHFNGGEPLLSKEHVEFLVNVPLKNQVQITYNTNATIRPNSELLKLWSQFKLVELSFSIDDIGERFEYQRYPAKWSDVSDNLQWFLDHSPHNVMFAINTTVSALNYHTIDQLKLWLTTNFHTSKFTDPIEHRQQLASGTLALDQLRTQSGFITKYLDELDARRGKLWRKIFPELDYYLNQTNKNQ
jgi:sulfatase maturation enzyme AslB (radical SAM superfamily)